MIGQTLGTYTIERELGRGGMGAVYTAVHNMLGRRAAVKVLLAELSRNQEVVQRFFNEARAATAIKHPSIVEIYDFGWAPDGSAYIVMELMEGESLASRLERTRRLPLAAALTIARQIATALAAAHKANIIHRDLKPDNVFLVPDPEVAGGERVKLLDFGIAKLAVEGVASRTSTGMVLGTPLYMSPEQCQGAKLVDARSDLYSLGCILFELIAGRPPFVSEGVGELIGMHQFVAPPPLRSLAPDVPPDVEALVTRLLAKSPAERPQSAAELATALSQLGGASQSLPSMPAALAAAGGPSVAASAPHVHPITTLSGAAGAARMTTPGRSRTPVWLGLGGLAVAGAAVAALLASGGGGSSGTAAGPVGSGVATGVDARLVAVEAPVLVDAAVAMPVDAAEAVALAVDAGPGPLTSLDPAREAEHEQQLRLLEKAAGAKEYAKAFAAAAAIPAESVHRARASEIIDALRAEFLAAQLAKGRELARRQRCSELDRLEVSAGKILPEARAELAKLPCTPAKDVGEGSGSGSGPGSGSGSGSSTVAVGELSRAQIYAGMNRIRPRVEGCAAKAYATGTVKIAVTVSPNGTVAAVTLKESPDAALGACVAAAAKTAIFPKTGGVTQFTFPFNVR